MPHRAVAATCPCTHAVDTRARRACQPASSAEDHHDQTASSRASTVAQTHQHLAVSRRVLQVSLLHPASASENMALARGVHHTHNDTRELSRTMTKAQAKSWLHGMSHVVCHMVVVPHVRCVSHATGALRWFPKPTPKPNTLRSSGHAGRAHGGGVSGSGVRLLSGGGHSRV